MNFLNPFELLEIENAEPALIKKAKRRKLTEFDLSDDGTIMVGSQKVTKSDFIRITDELDNPEKREFYLYILENQALNNFLMYENISFLSNYRQENMFSNQDFINFISSYYAEQYNKVLLKAFENEDIHLLKKIGSNSPLVTNEDKEKCYKGVSFLLKSLTDELQEIRNDIDNEESYYDEDTVEELYPDLQEKANANQINILPSYFQNQRNEIAQKIRNISVAVFNGINDAEASFKIISYSLSFNINNLTKQKLQKDYEQIKEIYESRKESESFNPELAKYATALLQIVELIKQVENNKIQSTAIEAKVNSLFSVSELNELPNVFDEIREQLALAIRGLSVAVWNKKNDIDVSIQLIQTAQKINLTEKIKSQIYKSYEELRQLRDKQSEPIIQVLQGINATIKKVNSTYGQSVNTDKVKDVLNDIFKPSVINSLKNLSSTAKLNVVNELKPTLSILPNSFVNNFVDKMMPIAANDSKLTATLQAMKKATPLQSPAANRPTSSSNSSDSSGCVWFLVVGGIIIALISFFSSNDSNQNTSTPIPTTNNTADYSPPPSNTYSNPSSTENYKPKPVEKSKYKGNHLANGASPFGGCFGKGKFGGSAWITFKNSNSSDAIVCLVSVKTQKAIRNEYIRAGSNYKMENIPSGRYYLKVFYGNDWNPNITNVCGTKGSFETDAHFSKSDSWDDQIEVNNSDYSYTTGEITLYTVANGNMSQSPINEQSFFSN